MIRTGPNPGFEGSGGGGVRSPGGTGWYVLGVSGLLELDVDGAPSSAAQPPLLKEDPSVIDCGGVSVT